MQITSILLIIITVYLLWMLIGNNIGIFTNDIKNDTTYNTYNTHNTYNMMDEINAEMEYNPDLDDDDKINILDYYMNNQKTNYRSDIVAVDNRSHTIAGYIL